MIVVKDTWICQWPFFSSTRLAEWDRTESKSLEGRKQNDDVILPEPTDQPFRFATRLGLSRKAADQFPECALVNLVLLSGPTGHFRGAAPDPRALQESLQELLGKASSVEGMKSDRKRRRLPPRLRTELISS